jgi:hypothetical protein
VDAHIVMERKNKKCFRKERREEVNLHSIFMEAVAKALKDFRFNISVDGDYHQKIHRYVWHHTQR